MSDITVYHVSNIQGDDDGSHGLPNVGFAPSIPQAGDSGSNVELPKMYM